MTLGELREYITTQTDKADDTLEIVFPGSDHSYTKASSVETTDAERAKNGDLSEYYDDENMCRGSKKVRVLEIR